MLDSIPYAIAMCAAVAAFWDAHRRRTLVMQTQLSVVLEFQEMKRDFDLLKVQLKKAVEVQHTNLNDALATLNARMDVEDMKRQSAENSYRRIG